jgi:hypothetical protein
MHEIRTTDQVPWKKEKERARSFPFSNPGGACSRNPSEWSGQSQEQSTGGSDRGAHRACDWSQLGLERADEVIAPPAGSGKLECGPRRHLRLESRRLVPVKASLHGLS